MAGHTSAGQLLCRKLRPAERSEAELGPGHAAPGAAECTQLTAAAAVCNLGNIIIIPIIIIIMFIQ